MAVETVVEPARGLQMNFRKRLTVLAAATVALSGVAYANPILRLQSGATTVTIAVSVSGPRTRRSSPT